MEAKGLGRSRFDYLPDIDSHAQAEDFEFVDQGDIHAAIDVFQQLGHLRYRWSGDRDSAIKDAAIQRAAQFRGRSVQPSYHLRYVAARNRVVARIFAFGREGDVEFLIRGGAVSGGLECARVLFQNGNEQLFRGAGIGCAFQHDELARFKVRSQAAGGGFDEAQVRPVMIIERGGHADDHRVHIRDAGKIGCGFEAIGSRGLNLSPGNADDVRAAFGERLDFSFVNVEAGDLELLFAEQKRQGKANISQSDDADICSTCFNLAFEQVCTV